MQDELEQFEIVNELVRAYRGGGVSRREFLRRAALLVGGAAMADALLLAAHGAPIPQVAEAAGEIQGTQEPTPAATLAATPTGLEIQVSTITFKSADGDVPGYLAQPTSGGPFPGVVVIQEWWGLDEHIQSVVQRFARLGYVALAPDLYRGKVATEPNDAQRLVIQVQRDKAMQDIQGAVDYLNAQSNVLPHKAGVVGFCFGGGLAMQMSYQGKGVGAVVIFYGAGVKPTDADFQKISVPVLGMYGEKDPAFPADLLKSWQDSFNKYNITNKMIVYKGAAHAFFNDMRDTYVKDAATDAWQQTLTWFQKYLTAEPDGAATAEATMAAAPGQ